MSGVVTVWGAAFNSAGEGVISLQQCLGCEPNGNQTRQAHDTQWLLTSSDGGRSWTRCARGYSLQHPLLVGQDGWAGGLQMLSRKQGGGAAQWEPGAGIARYFVTHDAGRSWSLAPSASPNGGGSVTSLVGNEVWAVGLKTSVAILHGPARGKQLIATTSQPIQGEYTNIHVQGAGPDTAYVVNGNVPQQAFATHDDGRTWQRLTPPPCTGKYAVANVDAAFGQTVWLTCAGGNDGRPRLVRSVDGGRSWRQLPADWGKDGPQQLAVASAQVAWVRRRRARPDNQRRSHLDAGLVDHGCPGVAARCSRRGNSRLGRTGEKWLCMTHQDEWITAGRRPLDEWLAGGVALLTAWKRRLIPCFAAGCPRLRSCGWWCDFSLGVLDRGGSP